MEKDRAEAWSIGTPNKSKAAKEPGKQSSRAPSHKKVPFGSWKINGHSQNFDNSSVSLRESLMKPEGDSSGFGYKMRLWDDMTEKEEQFMTPSIVSKEYFEHTKSCTSLVVMKSSVNSEKSVRNQSLFYRLGHQLQLEYHKAMWILQERPYPNVPRLRMEKKGFVGQRSMQLEMKSIIVWRRGSPLKFGKMIVANILTAYLPLMKAQIQMRTFQYLPVEVLEWGQQKSTIVD